MSLSRKLLLIAAACFAVAAILFAVTGTWWAAAVTLVIAIGLAVASRR
jgi:hypothetical protein